MRHQRNEDSRVGGAGSSPFCFCQLVVDTSGDQKHKLNKTNSESVLPGWKLQALAYATAHSVFLF